jgi:hypothetical protein
MTKLMCKLILLVFGIASLAHAAPDKLPGSVAVHIAKTHYIHPVLLLHPYLNVWHMKGPLAEKAAMASMQPHFSQVSECEDDSRADVVVLLEPHMFYNAQLQVYHAEFIARVYTDDGAPITRIKKQAQQLGPITISPDFYMEKAYTKAINKVIAELMTDQVFLDALNKNKHTDAGKLCEKLDLLPLDKFYY